MNSEHLDTFLNSSINQEYNLKENLQKLSSGYTLLQREPASPSSVQGGFDFGWAV